MKMKKIKNPIESPTSFVGKVYEIAFVERKGSLGEIAREYLKREGNRNPQEYKNWTGKVSEYIEKHPDYFDVKGKGGSKEKTVKSRVGPIVDLVDEELKRTNERGIANIDTLTDGQRESIEKYLQSTFREKLKKKREDYKRRRKLIIEQNNHAEEVRFPKPVYSYGVLQEFYSLVSLTLVAREIKKKVVFSITSEAGIGLDEIEENIDKLKTAVESAASNSSKRIKSMPGGSKEEEKIDIFTSCFRVSPEYLIEDVLEIDAEIINGSQFIDHWVGKMAWIPEVQRTVSTHRKAIETTLDLYKRGLANFKEE